jgi:hypothetical protein
MSQQEQPKQGGIPINSSTDAFWFFMDSHQFKKKNRLIQRKPFRNQKSKRRYRPKFRVFGVSDVWSIILKFMMESTVGTVENVGLGDES